MSGLWKYPGGAVCEDWPPWADLNVVRISGMTFPKHCCIISVLQKLNHFMTKGFPLGNKFIQYSGWTNLRVSLIPGLVIHWCVVEYKRHGMCMVIPHSYLTRETPFLGTSRSILWAALSHGIWSRIFSRTPAHMKSECVLFSILIAPIAGSAAVRWMQQYSLSNC